MIREKLLILFHFPAQPGNDTKPLPAEETVAPGIPLKVTPPASLQHGSRHREAVACGSHYRTAKVTQAPGQWGHEARSSGQWYTGGLGCSEIAAFTARSRNKEQPLHFTVLLSLANMFFLYLSVLIPPGRDVVGESNEKEEPC